MTDLAAIPLAMADGSTMRLADHAGQVVLVVNVASRCGLTSQYESLERLFEAERGRGLVVLGFPSNQFRDQEPGTDEEIQAFCRSTYGVTFPVLSKVWVNGPDRHPLYSALLAAMPAMHERAGNGMRERLAKFGPTPPPTDVLWNFEKFLLGRNGRVVGRYAPDITVDEAPLREAIEDALSRPG